MKFPAVQLFICMIFSFILFACHSARPGHILAIGDSNGAHADGWVTQLRKQRPEDSILNLSISGNTIGFDNLGRDTLNTLAHIQEYLSVAQDSLEVIDKIIVLLGTNDCKAMYDTLQEQVVANMEQLITRIQAFPYAHTPAPEIIVVSPPPMSADSLLTPKYYGGRQCVANLILPYQSIAKAHDCTFIDIYHPLLPHYDSLTVDGVHLNEKGYIRMATLISKHM